MIYSYLFVWAPNQTLGSAILASGQICRGCARIFGARQGSADDAYSCNKLGGADAASRQKDRTSAANLSCREYKIPAEAFDKQIDKNLTPEADIVVRHKNSGELTKQVMIEVKKGTDREKYAANMFIPTMTEALGRIDRFVVVYTGETVKERDVEYVNAFDFLMDIGGYVL